MGSACSARNIKVSPKVDNSSTAPVDGKALEHLTGDGIFHIDLGFEDKRLPLTVNELFRLNSSWKAVHRQIHNTGVEFFTRLFETEPAMRKYFDSDDPSLSNSESVVKNPLLITHAELVMGAIDSIILNFHNFDLWSAKIDKVGKAHRKLEGFSPEYFCKIGKPLMQALQTTLGTRLTPQIESIYQRTFSAILEEVEKAFSAVD